MNWQPMETAPLRQDILVFGRNRMVDGSVETWYEVYWLADESIKASTEGDFWTSIEEPPKERDYHKENNLSFQL